MESRLAQTNQLQNNNASMEDRRTSIAELQWNIDLLGKEVDALGSQRTAAESFAAEAVRMARLKDDRVEELCKWCVAISRFFTHM